MTDYAELPQTRHRVFPMGKNFDARAKSLMDARAKYLTAHPEASGLCIFPISDAATFGYWASKMNLSYALDAHVPPGYVDIC